MKISDFYKVDGCNYASYDNYRKIASICDGLKPSSRKCLYTIIKNNVSTPKKVEQLQSMAAEQTQYIHGATSLGGVIVTMAQDFSGSNNIPLLKREGTFGNRLKPEAAAGRYIFTCKEDYLDKIFKKDDEGILIEQEFEGDIVEPKFYVPIIPMLAINGSIGLTTGFTQKILQRNPKDVIKYIEAKLNNEETLPKLIPWFVNFDGEVIENKDKKEKHESEGWWQIIGKYNKISNNEIEITEIPVNYNLEDYVAVLDKLEDDKLIKDYKDLSDGGKFKFRVKFYRTGQGYDINDKNLKSKLKLVSQVSEIYTSLNEENKVVEYESIYEIIDDYYDVRLEYYQKRKNWLIDDLTKKLIEAVSKYTFINGVVSGDIVISKKTDSEIIEQLEKFKNIIKINDSYDYLINMPIRSLTKAQMDKFKDQIKTMKIKLDETRSTSINDMWKKDLNEFKKVFFK